jgi:hypothetical protein
LVRWVCTSNPFYVLSAGLFLVGLWVSFGAQVREMDTWALTFGLAGYTLLLAVTACLLVRFGNVWDDVRTVLLLVVLMFLATSVTFDEALVSDPARGLACCLGGLLFAVAVTEGLLRGMRLALPGLFRVPYYLILALFFLYPPALTPLVDQPRSEALMWGLFGFSTAAGLVFLTLLPAARRGPEYVRDNGSPWRWPLYPWVLFGVLGFAVPGRAFLLCWSMQLLDAADRDRLIFGPYFLVPFGLAIAILLLEGGLARKRRGTIATALALPVGLAVLAAVGHRHDPIYQGFLDALNARLGGGPVFLTLLAAAGFYAYATLRRVPGAAGALTAVLMVLAVVDPDTLDTDELVVPRPEPLLAAALLQLALGLRRRSAWHCLVGTGLAAGAALALPEEVAFRGPIAFHLGVLGVLTIGAAFNDAFGRLLRGVGAALVLLACLGVTLARPAEVPPWAILAYPLVMAAFLLAYGLWLRHRPSYFGAAAGLACGGVGACWTGYRTAREVVAGLDQIALSLALFGLAVFVSLGKSGALSRWMAAWRGTGPAFEGPGGEEPVALAAVGSPPDSLNVRLPSPREVQPE